MEALALSQPTPRSTHRPLQLVLVRANGPLFYSVAAASLLETGMPLAADRLLYYFGADQVLSQWITAEWLPRKMARAAQLREYVSVTWPEFDWHAGQEQFRAAAEAAGGTGPHRPSAAHEALARCVATAQSGIFYRSLARWAEDPTLRGMAKAMAEEEALAFSHFRNVYDRRLKSQGLGCATAWTTAMACTRSARDSLVPRAFNAINAQCIANVPFPVLEYPEFLTRMGAVIERHGHLGTPERVLFRAWKSRPRIQLAKPQQRAPTWFKPVLGAAA